MVIALLLGALLLGVAKCYVYVQEHTPAKTDTPD